MGLECFQTIVYPVGNDLKVDSDGFSITNNNKYEISGFRRLLEKIPDIKYDSPRNDNKNFNVDNYFIFNDSENTFQILLYEDNNNKELLESISFRFTLCNSKTVIHKLTKVLKIINSNIPISMFVPILNLTLPVNDNLNEEFGKIVVKSKEKFVDVFGNFEKSLLCGEDFFDYIKENKE